MNKIILLLLIIMFPLASAYSTINIYLDNSGNAVFLGETNSVNLDLPNGIEINNGKITGNTFNLTNKMGELWDFSYSLDESEFQIFLPENAKVLDTDGEISILKDKIVVYGINKTNIQYILGEKSEETNNWKIALILILIFIVVYFIKKRSKEKSNKIKMLGSVLNVREKLILSKLEETGKIKSSYLRKKLEIPKASFSRYLRELEKKKLIKLSGEGRNKFVELN